MMDSDSSSKFIGSLTKFLQSLCNGYVEFQRGVELVGHIYLSIDTGEKVDYILHERVSKNDENSVTFVSNSFHAQPLDKEKSSDSKDSSSKSGANTRSKNSSDEDDDIVIIDQSKGVPGSSNSGTIPLRGVKRAGSPSSSDRHLQRMRVAVGPSGPSRGSSSFHQNNRQQQSEPSATVTNQSGGQRENLSISNVKLEQISKDELMSLASHVGEGGSRSSQGTSSAAHSHSPRSEGGVWIKQEAADDDDGGGNETGWSHGRDDSNSNSGSNLYPVMLHQNPAAYSGSAFPAFSGPGSSGSQSGANPYADPMPGTSQDSSGLDPSGLWNLIAPAKPCKQGRTNAQKCRRYRTAIKKDPERLAAQKAKDKARSQRNYRRALTEEELELRREKWRQYSKLYRLKKKAQQTCSDVAKKPKATI